MARRVNSALHLNHIIEPYKKQTINKALIRQRVYTMTTDNKGYIIYETRGAALAAIKPGEISALRTGNNRPEGAGWAYFACIPRDEACKADIDHHDKNYAN